MLEFVTNSFLLILFLQRTCKRYSQLLLKMSSFHTSLPYFLSFSFNCSNFRDLAERPTLPTDHIQLAGLQSLLDYINKQKINSPQFWIHPSKSPHVPIVILPSGVNNPSSYHEYLHHVYHVTNSTYFLIFWLNLLSTDSSLAALSHAVVSPPEKSVDKNSWGDQNKIGAFFVFLINPKGELEFYAEAPPWINVI